MNREAENNRDYNDINAGAMSYENIMGIETQILPTVTLRGLSILPGMVIHFDLSRDRSIEAVEQAMLADQRMLVVTQKEAGQEEPGFEDVYEVGTVAVIKQIGRASCRERVF